MKFGTWNLQQAAPPSPRATAQHQAMQDIAADVWLLTEVHLDVALDGQVMHLSTPRAIKPRQRWAGVSSRWPTAPLDSPHEGLALARIASPEGPLLVACSVMPWRGAAISWPGDPTAKHGVRFADAIEAHLGAIQGAREASEALIWGGDFNQALEGRETAGSLAGRALLLQAIAGLGLQPVTGHLDHRITSIKTIDHIAVPASWVPSRSAMEMPLSIEGRPLSDHAAYVVDASPP